MVNGFKDNRTKSTGITFLVHHRQPIPSFAQALSPYTTPIISYVSSEMLAPYSSRLPANLWPNGFYVVLWRSNTQPYTFYYCRDVRRGRESGTQWQLGGAGYPYKKDISPVDLVHTPGILGLFCLNWRYQDWDNDGYQEWFKLFDAVIANSRRVDKEIWLETVLQRMLERQNSLIMLRPSPRSEFEDLEEEIEDFRRAQARVLPRTGSRITVYSNFFRKA
jgi:hypothetical protein